MGFTVPRYIQALKPEMPEHLRNQIEAWWMVGDGRKAHRARDGIIDAKKDLASTHLDEIADAVIAMGRIADHCSLETVIEMNDLIDGLVEGINRTTKVENALATIARRANADARARSVIKRARDARAAADDAIADLEETRSRLEGMGIRELADYLNERGIDADAY